jgi:hypothetical protein
MQPKYPDVYADIIGKDGNAFSILAVVQRAMRQGGVPQEQISVFFDQAMSGDYDHLLRTVMEWVSISGSNDDEEY